MIAFTGRLSFKQYLPAKPIKRAIKVWMRCDSIPESCYLNKFNIYLGKGEGGVTEHGLGYNVVTSLCQSLHGKYHHVFFDNYFTSKKLMENLLNNGVYSAGTVRQNRCGFPEDLKRVKKLLARGDRLLRQSTDTNNLTATIWMDRKIVSVLSTLSKPDSQGNPAAYTQWKHPAIAAPFRVDL